MGSPTSRLLHSHHPICGPLPSPEGKGSGKLRNFAQHHESSKMAAEMWVYPRRCSYSQEPPPSHPPKDAAVRWGGDHVKRTTWWGSNPQQDCTWWEFPGGPRVRTQHFHCRGPRFKKLKSKQTNRNPTGCSMRLKKGLHVVWRCRP